MWQNAAPQEPIRPESMDIMGPLTEDQKACNEEYQQELRAYEDVLIQGVLQNMSPEELDEIIGRTVDKVVTKEKVSDLIVEPVQERLKRGFKLEKDK